MKNHNFVVSIVDTDSITISKEDGSEFDSEEIDKLTEELNSISLEHIKWDREFYIPTIVIVASKNYVLDYGNKVKIKGASLKATRKEKYLQDFIKGVIDILLQRNWNYNQVVDLYNKTAKECLDLTDMSNHSYKVAITDKVLNGDRTIALRVKVALRGVNYQQGDKFRMFFLPDGNLCLESNFKGIYDERRLLQKLYDTVHAFEDIIPMENFTNYKILKNYYEFSGKPKPVKARKGTKIAKDVD